MKYTVKQKDTLLAYLNTLPISKKDAKNYLTRKMVMVNGQIQTHYLYELKEGDILEIGAKKTETSLDILYEDNEIIVINKPSGLLSMASEKEKSKTAYHLVREYLQKQNRNNKVFIVHRLDQDTSGVLMFAKNEKIKRLFQDQWNDLVNIRGYLAIIEGSMERKEGTIETFLEESKSQMVYVSKTGKKAITHYKTIKQNKNYSLLEINLDTGRKNQIRVHLSYYKHPIVGDLKYGSHINPIHRLALHSHILELKHPVTHKILRFEAAMPEIFNRLI